MILQFGTLFSGLVSGLGSLAKELLPTGLEVGKAFLSREINRKQIKRQQRRERALAVQALNSPGIAVTRLGGTRQPVGGRVQRATFTPAALTPAQSPFGNVPLVPVRGRALATTFPLDPFAFRKPVQQMVRGVMARNGQGPLNLQFRVPGAVGEPKFAKDEMGRTIMFVPSPDGSGFISVQQARANNLSAMKPWWRFNRIESQFEKISPRRMNPFNFRAAKRAGRRIERTLEAIKGVVTIQRKMEKGISAGGKIVKFKTGKKRKKA